MLTQKSSPVNFRMLLTMSLSAFLFSCSTSTNNINMVGDWQGVQWMVGNAPGNYDVMATSFHFDPQGTYSFTYKSNVEKGAYKVENNMLFTRPEGENEMMVYIEKQHGDTLQFRMNRGGTNELLTLIRVR